MQIKLDENLPARLVEELRQLAHDVDTVADENLTGAMDERVWIGAQATSRFLITQDLDFSDIRKYAPGTHAGVLELRLREPSRSRLLDRVSRLFHSERVEDWSQCVVVATDAKLRIRRP